ncbi:MAG: SIS domain-containing protein [Flavobacteriaceae bacterium]
MDSSNTLKEILAQPSLWHETFSIIKDRQQELGSFLDRALIHEDLKIFLVGAGSSAYIGEVLQNSFQKKIGRVTEAVASTDLISHSKNFLKKQQPTLMVSFARSGDSPESLAAVNLAETHCQSFFHLVITCNAKGALAENAKGGNACVLLMPETANDKGLAMTGSFTTMLLAGVLVSDLDNLNQNKTYVKKLSEYGQKIIDRYKEKLKTAASLNFNRIVFLGSGMLKGIARESQLKVQELTNGQVVGIYDSFLGLRHGPKAVINDSTLVVYLFSNDDFVNKYEYDLVRSINRQKEKLFEIGVGQNIRHKDDIELDLLIEVSDTNHIPEDYFAICAVLPGQLISLYKSIDLGLSPDSPSLNKAINRVVQGVTIYQQK